MQCLWQPPFLRVDCQPFWATNMGLELVPIVLLLLAGELFQSEAKQLLPYANIHSRPCFHCGRSKIWDSGKVRTEGRKSFENGKIKTESGRWLFSLTTSQDVTLATSHGVEMQCAQECSKAACGAFYVQVKKLKTHSFVTSLCKDFRKIQIGQVTWLKFKSKSILIILSREEKTVLLAHFCTHATSNYQSPVKGPLNL